MSERRIELGRPGGPRLRLRVVSRAHPGGLYVFDHDWLFALVQVETSERTLRYEAFLRTHDFARLQDELAALRDHRRDDAALAPKDPWLVVRLRRAGATTEVEVDAHDNGSERVARCAFAISAAELDALAEQLGALTTEFPVAS